MPMPRRSRRAIVTSACGRASPRGTSTWTRTQCGSCCASDRTCPEIQAARPGGPRRSFCSSPYGLELHDVLRRRALLALHDVELDPLALSQRLEALCLDRGVVNEAVLLPVLGCDETETLRVVEPLHDTGNACHLLYS